jgi:hypothetical protein
VRALLRYQATVLLRSGTWPRIAFFLFGFGIYLQVLVLAVKAEVAGESFALAGTAAAPFFLIALVQSVQALDDLRWSRPVGAGRALRAHFLFWSPVWGLISGIAAAIGGEGWESRGWILASGLLLGMGLCGCALLIQQGMNRPNLVLIILLPLLLLGTIGHAILASIFGVRDGASGVALVLLPSAAISVIAGVRAFMGAESLPPAQGSGAEDTPARAPAGALPRGRTPSLSILRAAFPHWAIMLANLGVLAVMVVYLRAEETDGVAICWIAYFGAMLSQGGLAGWRWLSATPLDRDRAFRLLFAPPLLVFAIGVVARAVVVEVSDRAAPFPTASRTLVDFGNASRYGEFPFSADPAVLADRAVARLKVRFGLDVDPGRVSAAVLRGWPRAAGRAYRDEAYVISSDALDRVREEFSPEIHRVLRIRLLADGLALFLLGLLLLRCNLASGWRGAALAFLLWLPSYGLAMPPVIRLTGTLVGDSVRVARDGYYASLQAEPVLMTLLLLSLSWMVLRACRTAFGEIEFDRLPPPPSLKSAEQGWWEIGSFSGSRP